MTVREKKRLRRCREAYDARLKSHVAEELPYKNQKWQRLLSTSFEFLTKMRRKQALALGIEEFQLEKQALKSKDPRVTLREGRATLGGGRVGQPSGGESRVTLRRGE